MFKTMTCNGNMEPASKESKWRRAMNLLPTTALAVEKLMFCHSVVNSTAKT